MENSKGDLKELSDEEVFEAGYEMEDVFPTLTLKEESQPPSSTNKDVIKDDLALNAKVVESIDAYVKNLAKLTELNLHMKEASSTYRQIFINLSNLVELLREANTPGLRNTLETI
ncbi:hypothetical protein Tco_1535977 [Tanacetum coccineum]